MSVSNPVGSGGGLVAFDRDLQGMAEQMNTVGGWAEIMAQDSLNNTVDEEEAREECADHSFQETRSSEPPSYPKSTDEPPYSVQVTNVPSTCNGDDLFFFFGGEEKIADINVRAEAGRAVIEFKTLEFLEEAQQKSRDRTLLFEGRALKIFKLQPDRTRTERRDREDRSSVSSRQGGNYPPRDNFSRQGSRYNSQSSLTSDVRGDSTIHRNEYGRPDYSRQQQPDHYGTMPPPGRGYNDFRGGYRGGGGGFRGGRGGGNRGPYDNRRGGGYYPGDMQRSESYTFDNERPAPVNRSRTDSVNMNRRQSDMNSRTSSQFSLNQDDSRPAPVKKPTSKDIFGDAKPVDTAEKLKEIDARIAARAKEEKERAEKERQQQQVMAASHPPPHHPHPQQHFQPQGYRHHGPPPPHFQQPYNPPMQFYSQCPPVYATPMVPQYPHTHHHPSMFSPEQTSPRMDGGVGTFKIMQRSEAERDSASVGNYSPPLDPQHEPAKEPAQSPVKEHPANQSQSSEAVKSDSSYSRGGKYNRGERTFFNSTHKSSSYSDQQGSRGSYRGRGGRGGSTRGGGHSGPRTDSHPVAESIGESNNNKENAATPVQDTSLNKEKEHHGSHASLKSRGQARPQRGGARGRSFKEKGPRNRDDRNAGRNGEQTKPEGQKEQRPPTKKEEEEKPQAKVPVAKVEVKETPVKPAQETEASTPTSDAKEKKKNKKKNPAKSSTSAMNGNRFAALLNADE